MNILSTATLVAGTRKNFTETNVSSYSVGVLELLWAQGTGTKYHNLGGPLEVRYVVSDDTGLTVAQCAAMNFQRLQVPAVNGEAPTRIRGEEFTLFGGYLYTWIEVPTQFADNTLNIDLSVR